MARCKLKKLRASREQGDTMDRDDLITWLEGVILGEEVFDAMTAKGEIVSLEANAATRLSAGKMLSKLRGWDEIEAEEEQGSAVHIYEVPDNGRVTG